MTPNACEKSRILLITPIGSFPSSITGVGVLLPQEAREGDKAPLRTMKIDWSGVKQSSSIGIQTAVGSKCASGEDSHSVILSSFNVSTHRRKEGSRGHIQSTNGSIRPQAEVVVLANIVLASPEKESCVRHVGQFGKGFAISEAAEGSVHGANTGGVQGHWRNTFTDLGLFPFGEPATHHRVFEVDGESFQNGCG